MKKLLLSAVITSALTVSLVNDTHASGIPVVDVASIIQTVTEGLREAQEFATQIQEARSRLNELKAQGEHYKDMVEGHYNFEDLINDPNVNQFMDLNEWKDIYNDTSNLANLRDEFGMHSDNPAIQKRMDRKLQQLNAQQQYYEATINRNNQLQSLLDQFTAATTPAAKEDIANAIALQKGQIENDKQMMSAMNTLMTEQNTLEADQAARAQRDQYMNTELVVPTNF